jgi:hypothetical protein
MPEAYQYLRLLLYIEQQRFLNFALEAGILYTDESLCAVLRVNRTLLLGVLAEIRALFKRYELKNGRYSALPQEDIDWDDKSEPGIGLMELLHFSSESKAVHSKKEERLKAGLKVGQGSIHTGKRLRTIFCEPTRLIWATFDQASFKELVSKIAHLNSFLIELLHGSQIRHLQQAIDTNLQEILQMRNDVNSLVAMVKALKADDNCKAVAASTISNQNAQTKKFEQLATIKLQQTHVAQKMNDDSTLIGDSLDPDLFQWHELTSNTQFNHGRTSAMYQGRSVWVEWKDIAPDEIRSQGDTPNIERRILLLTKLLIERKPKGFCAPPCLGYVKIHHQDYGSQFGIVFQKTPKEPTSDKLITLRELLEHQPKPSLSTRVALSATLAKCLHSFHAVNWLHKGLRSKNVIFFCSPDGFPDYSEPLVSGFELSRPHHSPEMTERPTFKPEEDMYRHQEVQSGQSNGNFRKYHDIYSLGIILIELAVWSPIEKFLDFGALETVKPSQLYHLKRNLLSDALRMDRIRSEIGDAFIAIIELCFAANGIERAIYDGETDGSIGGRLQRVLEEDIFGKLRTMELALKP